MQSATSRQQAPFVDLRLLRLRSDILVGGLDAVIAEDSEMSDGELLGSAVVATEIERPAARGLLRKKERPCLQLYAPEPSPEREVWLRAQDETAKSESQGD